MHEELLDRTRKALGDDLVQQIQNIRFCVVGCGGTGASFAEMLIRSGAQHLALVDGDRVDASNLNRVLSFSRKDIGKKKVEVLKARFLEINPELSVTAIPVHLREYDRNDRSGQDARDTVHDSSVVILTVDKNRDRIECEKLCHANRNIKTLGIGVGVNANGEAEFEVTWCGKTPEEKADEEGYGVGSYVSIVAEATAIAFTMMLHQIKSGDSPKYSNYYKKYRDFAQDQINFQ